MELRIRFCPFCGETQKLYVVYEELDGLLVECQSCGAKGPAKNSDSAAIAAWNNRPWDYDDPYGKEPRYHDGHELECRHCAHSQKRVTNVIGLEILRPLYCPIWQINVPGTWHCSSCKPD